MKHVFEKGVWKVVLSCSVVMMLATFFIVACSKDDVVEHVDFSSQVLENSDFKKELTEISSIHFEFETNEGAVISATPFASYFFLSKSNPQYDEYLKLAQGDRFKLNFRKITIAPVVAPSLGKVLIEKIEALSQDELAAILRSYVSPEKQNSSLLTSSIRNLMQFPIPDNAEIIYSHLRQEKGELLGDIIFLLPPSAAVYYLSPTVAHFEEYKKLLNATPNGELLKFTVGEKEYGRFPILKIESPTYQEAKLYAKKRINESPSHRATELRSSLKIDMSWNQAKKFFRQFQRESCSVSQKSLCIPFQYTTNGCYARAHYMRKLMADAVYDCQKIFNFAISSIPLSVVNRNGNCIQWNYYVAPLVTIRGVGDRVLDPSLFDEPVSPQTWIEKMKSNCGGWGIPTMLQRITPSDVYYENYYTGERKYDDDSSLTYQEMENFSGLEDG